ncbi:TPA: glycosyltransferase family 2 protein [Klebsiella aerogenes]|nr:glycosyltransferase family 2 protein [Klebsiella aerogenes]
MKYYIAIPTYNGGDLWRKVVKNIKRYTPDNTLVYIIDSSSKDDTTLIAEDSGFDVFTIDSMNFNHGGTRNLAIEQHFEEYDIVIFLTQDAIPQDGFIESIITAFKDESVVCAYGRQLPHDDANPLATHAREFSYPGKGYVSGKESIKAMGIKTVFMSNSFSAYRLSVFKELGGFPSNTILCEDMFYTTKAILAGYRVAYVADAVVQHSHNYSPVEEFKRYFDIGVFHKMEPWIRESISDVGGEGKKYIFSEFIFLLKNAPHWIPLACVNNAMKIMGYNLGKRYKKLPMSVVKLFSMHKKYWE